MKTVRQLSAQVTPRELVKRGLQLYPQSKTMRKTWVRQTYHLLQTRRHAWFDGGFPATGFGNATVH